MLSKSYNVEVLSVFFGSDIAEYYLNTLSEKFIKYNMYNSLNQLKIFR